MIIIFSIAPHSKYLCNPGLVQIGVSSTGIGIGAFFSQENKEIEEMPVPEIPIWCFVGIGGYLILGFVQIGVVSTGIGIGVLLTRTNGL